MLTISDYVMRSGFPNISSIAAWTLKMVNNVRRIVRRNHIFKLQKVRNSPFSFKNYIYFSYWDELMKNSFKTLLNFIR